MLSLWGSLWVEKGMLSVLNSVLCWYFQIWVMAVEERRQKRERNFWIKHREYGILCENVSLVRYKWCSIEKLVPSPLCGEKVNPWSPFPKDFCAPSQVINRILNRWIQSHFPLFGASTCISLLFLSSTFHMPWLRKRSIDTWTLRDYHLNYHINYYLDQIILCPTLHVLFRTLSYVRDRNPCMTKPTAMLWSNWPPTNKNKWKKNVLAMYLKLPGLQALLYLGSQTIKAEIFFIIS